MTDVVDPARWLQGTRCSVPRVLDLWEKGTLADVPAGHDWDIVRLPQRYGLTVLSDLRAHGQEVGPVLLASRRHTVDVLVDVGAAAVWNIPGTFAFGHGSALHCPHPNVTAPWTVGGATWLVPPRDTREPTPADGLYRVCLRVLTEYEPSLTPPAEAFG